ncbi:hypothetical protein P67b_00084 [Ruegeria phage Tedan]|nr:hypothetical protein P67b_00084 [Ruegeria phage Tedan]
MPDENVQTITLTAATGADINKRRFVSQGASGVAHTTDGDDAVGVSMGFYDDSENTAGNATTAHSVAVNQGMRIGVEAGAAVAIGDDVSSDGTGRVITSASGDAILGVAVSAGTAAGQIVDVVFSKAGRATA